MKRWALRNWEKILVAVFYGGLVYATIQKVPALETESAEHSKDIAVLRATQNNQGEDIKTTKEAVLELYKMMAGRPYQVK